MKFWLFLVACLCHCDGVQVHPRNCRGTIRHVRLAIGPQASSSMIVSFATIPSKFSPAPVGGVRIGTKADNLNVVYQENRQESPSFYNVTTGKAQGGQSELYFSPYYHHVLITGLKSSTKYYYQPVVQVDEEAFVQEYGASNFRRATNITKLHAEAKIKEQRPSGNDSDLEHRRKLVRWGPYDGSGNDCPPLSKIRNFRTGPAYGSQISANFAIMGDLGQFPHSEETMERLLHSKHEVNAVILAGDLAYTGRDHRRWDTFLDFLDDYAAFESIPMLICPGNHDIDKLPQSSEIFLAYENRFRMPHVQPAELGLYDGPLGDLNMDRPPFPLPYEFGNAYYSWQYAGAFFLSVSAYSSTLPDSIQYQWINEELRRANRLRDIFPWLIVVMHTPIYNTFGKHLKDTQIIVAREHLEPLFLEHRVNFVFTGHIHAYLRTRTVALGMVNSTGPVHITVGAGGRACEAPFRQKKQEEWVAVRDATMYGYGMLRLHNASVAEWDWIQTSPTDDERDFNQIVGSDERLPAGPQEDHVFVHNQFFL